MIQKLCLWRETNVYYGSVLLAYFPPIILPADKATRTFVLRHKHSFWILWSWFTRYSTTLINFRMNLVTCILSQAHTSLVDLQNQSATLQVSNLHAAHTCPPPPHDRFPKPEHRITSMLTYMLGSAKTRMYNVCTFNTSRSMLYCTVARVLVSINISVFITNTGTTNNLFNMLS